MTRQAEANMHCLRPARSVSVNQSHWQVFCTARTETYLDLVQDTPPGARHSPAHGSSFLTRGRSLTRLEAAGSVPPRRRSLPGIA